MRKFKAVVRVEALSSYAPEGCICLNGIFIEEKYDIVTRWMANLTLAQLDKFELMLKEKGAILKRTLADGQIILNVMDDCSILSTEEAFA